MNSSLNLPTFIEVSYLIPSTKPLPSSNITNFILFAKTVLGGFQSQVIPSAHPLWPDGLSSGANFIELLKHKICLSTNIACLFFHMYWPSAVYLA